MKKNVFAKNLSLNKETIVHLDPLGPRQMEAAKGGCTTLTIETCNGCGPVDNRLPKESDNTCYTQPGEDT